MLPIVSFVGRPSVGKSSLFNRVIRKRHAVVGELEGITRDRHYAEAQWNRTTFSAVDTGGLVPTARTALLSASRRQVDIAIEESAVIVFVAEAGAGPTDLDLMIARKLQKQAPEKVIVAVNKAESKQLEFDLARYHSLGLGEPHAVSALHGKGVGDLLDTITRKLRTAKETLGRPAPKSVAVKIAIVGRPNVGKSSLVNKLLREERMIVDSAAGTTRDAIDSELAYYGKKIVLVDTAGLRKRTRVHESVEYHSNLRALDSIVRADICLLMIDAANGIGEQDLRIARKIAEARKGMILCWNKWDIVPKDTKTFDTLVKETKSLYRELRHIPMLAISALTGQRLDAVLRTALEVQERMHAAAPAKELEDAVIEWTKAHPHSPVEGTKEVRVLGAKQRPARFPLFFVYATNAHNALPPYARYLTNKILDKFDFRGCPVIVEFKPAGTVRRQ
jgi:GTP-binding protein